MEVPFFVVVFFFLCFFFVLFFLLTAGRSVVKSIDKDWFKGWAICGVISCKEYRQGLVQGLGYL